MQRRFPPGCLGFFLGIHHWRGSFLVRRVSRWKDCIAAGCVLFLLLALVQWTFAAFLLTPAADNWFSAGGGKIWPFFINIEAPARTMFRENAS